MKLNIYTETDDPKETLIGAMAINKVREQHPEAKIVGIRTPNYMCSVKRNPKGYSVWVYKETAA